MDLVKRFNNAITGTYLACKSDLKTHSASYKRLFAICVTLGAIFNGAALAFADGSVTQFSTDITSKLVEIYHAMFPVITILAAIFAALALVTRMTANQQKAAQATSWLVRIAIAYVGLNAIGLILSVIKNSVDSKWYEVDTSNPSVTPK